MVAKAVKKAKKMRKGTEKELLSGIILETEGSVR